MSKTNPCPGYTVKTGSRREFLWQLGGGLGGVALASILKDGGYNSHGVAVQLSPGRRP